jgi:hypothetical protein
MFNLFTRLQELASDFSAKICEDLKLEDLDTEAITAIKKTLCRKTEQSCI